MGSLGSATLEALLRVVTIGVELFNPNSIPILGKSTYLVTVNDTALGTPSAPKGRVFFKALNYTDQLLSAGGTLNSTHCELIPVSSSASECGISYSASSDALLVEIQPNYTGDAIHRSFAPPINVLLKVQTNTSTTITPNKYSAGTSAHVVLTAFVTDTSIGVTGDFPYVPIEWSDGGAGGTFSAHHHCTTIESNPTMGYCSITYTTPASAPNGTVIMITASFGAGAWLPSSGEAAITIIT
jgi:hypothetical protein